jgi:chromosome partitioning protein
MTSPFSTPAMRVMVFASQKGGSGKTTLAGHVAVQAELAGGGPVALIDADPQGSLAKWWNAREARTPVFIQSQFSSLYQDIESAREQGFRLVVIDTPPAVTRAISEVVAHADLVVVPTRPSPHDLRAVGPTVDIIEGRRKQMIFVVNAATARAKITQEAAIALSQHGTVAPVTVHNRLDFAASMIDGRTVMEIDAMSRSAAEVVDLWRYLSERLMRLDPPHQVNGMAGAAQMRALRPTTTFGRAGSSFGRRAFG